MPFFIRPSACHNTIRPRADRRRHLRAGHQRAKLVTLPDRQIHLDRQRHHNHVKATASRCTRGFPESKQQIPSPIHDIALPAAGPHAQHWKLFCAGSQGHSPLPDPSESHAPRTPPPGRSQFPRLDIAATSPAAQSSTESRCPYMCREPKMPQVPHQYMSAQLAHMCSTASQGHAREGLIPSDETLMPHGFDLQTAPWHTPLPRQSRPAPQGRPTGRPCVIQQDSTGVPALFRRAQKRLLFPVASRPKAYRLSVAPRHAGRLRQEVSSVLDPAIRQLLRAIVLSRPTWRSGIRTHSLERPH